MRLDKALASLYPNISRSSIQKWLKLALVTVDDEVLPQKQKLQGGEIIAIQPQKKEMDANLPEQMDLDIVYEDADVIVINKPATLVVHPGAGNQSGTLMNGLLCYDKSLFELPRAGIVHRLDKQTSGLMVVARTETARLRLVEQLQARDVTRKYLTIVNGLPISGGTVDAAISRHSHDRRKMAVNLSGKEAISHYRINASFNCHSLLSVSLESGRTHQIRVHMQHIGLPVLGDPVYGRRLILPKNSSDRLTMALRDFKRQALHAQKLSFIHPTTEQKVSFEQSLPKDMENLLLLLEENWLENESCEPF